jgi:uncharacterized Zn finger protein
LLITVVYLRINNKQIEIMRTVSGVLSASVAMASNDYLVQIAFALLTFYLIYRELKSDKELSE